MIVVADTSPLRALQVTSLLAFLPREYGDVLVPAEVAAELNVNVPGLGPLDVSALPGFSVAKVANAARVTELAQSLDLGEAAAIALALERRADVLLVDEYPARATAIRLGLRPLGALGVLIRAKELGQIAAVSPLIDRLRQELAFRIADDLLLDVLKQVGEA